MNGETGLDIQWNTRQHEKVGNAKNKLLNRYKHGSTAKTFW